MNKLWSKVLGILTGFIALFAISFNAQAADLGGNPNVSITDSKAGNTATYTVSFTTSATGAIPASGRVDVVFPAGFNISGASLGAHSGNLGAATLSVVGQTARISLGAGGGVGNSTSANFQLVGAVNGQTTGMYHVNVSTYTNTGSLIDGPTNSFDFSIQPRAPNQAQSSISPSADTSVTPGSVTAITITSRDEYGNVTPDQDVLWSNSNSNFSLSSTTGLTNGSGQNSVNLTAPVTIGEVTTVTAEIGGIVTHITLTSGDIYVVHGPATSITISPVGPIGLTADGSQVFTATAHDDYGNSWDVTGDVNWHENDPVGYFAGNVYNAGSVGTWTIYASFGALNSNNVTANISHGAAVSIAITPVGSIAMTADDSQAFIATATDSDGNTWNATADVTWHEDDPAGSFAGNVYNAGSVGTWTIYASIGAVNSNNVTANISHGAAASININPVGPINLTSDQSQAFTATATDSDGNTWDVTGLVTWHENDPWGNFTGNTYNAGQVGSWTIYASLGALNSNNVAVNVSHGVEVSMHITPVGPLSMTADDTQLFEATLSDADGNVWNVTASAVWYENDPSGYFFGNLYNAGTVGTWQIYAGYNSVTSNVVDVNVAHGIATAININPVGPISLTADDSQAFIATATDADGNIWDVTGEVTWHENDPVGYFAGNVYNAGSVGTWTIYASLGALNSNNVTANVSHGAAISIGIAPVGPLAMTADDSQAFTATATDADGNNWDVTGLVTWHENDPAGSFAGNVYNAGSVGTWTIYASLGALNSNNVTANVSHGAAVSVGITPVGPISLTADESQAFIATATDADGNTWDATADVTWHENDPAGSFAGNVYNAGSVGTWTIYATLGALNSNNVTANVSHGAAISVGITPVGPVNLTADQSQAFTATATDSDGNTWDITGSVTWNENDPWGSFTGNTYNAGQVGSWTIYASLGALNSNNVTVNVSPGALHHIYITPDTTQTITAGGTVTFAAVGYDQDGNVIPGQVFSWNNAVNGIFNNTTAGTYSVYAYVGAIQSNHVDVVVNPGALHHINITPNTDQNITAGQTIQFTAQGYDSYNNPISGLVYTWDATTDASGLFSNTTAGTYQVRAHSGAVYSNIVNVTVHPGALHHIHITPDTTQTITAGGTVQFTATSYDQYNNVISGVTYSWNNAQNGLFNNTHAGSYSVYAYIGAIESNNTAVNVNPGALHSISITPSAAQNINSGETIQFTVQGYDAYGNAISGLTYAWSNTDASGLFTNAVPGTYTVQANIGSIFSNTVNVTVHAAVGGTVGGGATVINSSSEGTEVVVDDSQGKIKGTEVTTIGPEQENAKKPWNTLLIFGLALLVLGIAYYAYYYMQPAGAAAGDSDDKEKKDEEPNGNNHVKPSEQTRW